VEATCTAKRPSPVGVRAHPQSTGSYARAWVCARACMRRHISNFPALDRFEMPYGQQGKSARIVKSGAGIMERARQSQRYARTGNRFLRCSERPGL
jgi:hypothetical protein